MKLGQLLLHRGLIDREQLQVALRRQARSGLPLGEVLLSMGIVSRAEILRALRRQPHASVPGTLLERVPTAVREMIPVELARRLVAMPVALTSDVLIVAMADPTDRAALETLHRTTGLEVIGVVSDPDEILAAIRETGSAAETEPAGR